MDITGRLCSVFIVNLLLSSTLSQKEEVSPSCRGREDHCLLPRSRIYEFLYKHTIQNLSWAWGQVRFDILGWDSLPSLKDSIRLRLKPNFLLTLLFALVWEHQTAVLTLCLEVRKPLFYFTEAKVFFKEGVTVKNGKGVYYNNSAW